MAGSVRVTGPGSAAIWFVAYGVAAIALAPAPDTDFANCTLIPEAGDAVETVALAGVLAVHRGFADDGGDVAGGGTEQAVDPDEHRSGGAAHLVARARRQPIQDPAAQLAGDQGPIDRPPGRGECGDPHEDGRPSAHHGRVAPGPPPRDRP